MSRRPVASPVASPVVGPALVAALPQPRAGQEPYRIAIVCLGNICRSPIAEVVLREKLAQVGLGGEVEVVSAGTGGWHIGNPMDTRAASVLAASGYDPSQHRAKQFEPGWLDECDLILAMDDANFEEIAGLGERARLRMFRDFDPSAAEGDRDVPDPYFGGEDGFDRVLAMVERTAAALVDVLPSGSDGR